MIKLDWKTCIRVGVSVFLLYLCIHYWASVSGILNGIFSAALPLFIGAGIAFVVNVLMKFYERHFFPRAKKRFAIRARRPLCIIFAYLSLIAVVAAVVWLVLPQLLSCVELILRKMPGILKSLVAVMQTWDFMPDDILAVLSEIDWSARINQIFDLLTSGLGDVVTVVYNAVSSVFSGLFTAIISIVFSVYLLAQKERLAAQIRRLMLRYLPQKWNDRSLYFWKTLSESFRRYIVGQTTEALILGSLVTLGMLLLRLPYAPMIGALVAVMAFVPIAGAYISGAVGALMLLSESPLSAVIFVVFLIVLQQIEGNLIYPRVVGSSLGLPAIWVLASVTIGGGLFGILGMVLAVPLAATAYALVKRDLEKREADENAQA